MYYKLYKEIESRLLYVWKELAKELSETYEEVASCNNDISRYLVPKGTADQISYYGKPAYSLRISDHWSWYANVKKCNDENYVQCENTLFTPNSREKEGGASKPIRSLQICIADRDGVYHHVIGFTTDMDKDPILRYEDMDVKHILEYIRLFKQAHI